METQIIQPKTINQFIDWIDQLPSEQKNKALALERKKLFEKKMDPRYNGLTKVKNAESLLHELKQLRTPIKETA